ncbi:MAG: hypothetical protein M1833_000688 [Piccolia ochrophora]|nr:MAG: hypothetical protein M1833_000688 [Piccolia ochrophora]
MSTQQLGLIKPLATVLPEPPPQEVLTSEQWTTFMAIAEAVVPEVRSSAQASPESKSVLVPPDHDALVDEIRSSVQNPPASDLVNRFLAEGTSNNPAFRREIQRTLGVNSHVDAQKKLALILTVLNTRAGSLVFNGTTTAFHQHSLADRTVLLRKWSESYLLPLRQVYHVMTLIVKAIWLKTSETMRPVLGLPNDPVHGRPGKIVDYKFQQPGDSTPFTLETDVVVIGSGCGGGVTAKNIAEDGHRVLVVEKSYHYPLSYYPMSELHGAQLLFEGGGSQPSDDSSVTVIAGSTFGGGGTINWSASLQTQGYVRKEWADQGLGFFTSAEYQTSLDRVCDRMGVSTNHIEHNHGNQMLLEGCRRLGYSARAVPQNTGGHTHYCGYCTLGCASAEKQGPVVTWLADAHHAGAEFMEGLAVESVTFDETSGSKKATGVRGKWTSRDKQTTQEVVIKAKKVVVSAGSLWSPLILLKSGLKNPQIGRNLKLHPVAVVFGVWPDEIKPWEGGILTSVCEEFQNIDGRGHGTKLETLVMLPSNVMPLIPGFGLDFKKLAAKFKHMNGFISLTRDQGSGRIYPDPTAGTPRIAYTPSPIDRKHCLEGVIALCKISYITGAEEIYVNNGVAPFIRSKHQTTESSPETSDAGVNNSSFQAWLDEIRTVGLPSPATPFCTAHQMGTCRMGTSERSSVVNPKGQVWGTENLFVADASVFPSASGVNPMVTNMAISDWTSRGIAKELRREARGPTQESSL